MGEASSYWDELPVDMATSIIFVPPSSKNYTGVVVIDEVVIKKYFSKTPKK
jgi:hypothetical protein